jgi:tetratricopeptide (TPR) repeat protein
MRYNPAESPSPKGSCTTREIDLATAISEIKQARETEDGRSPFFIIAGAGISAPIIPLASEIARECKEIAAKYNRTAEPINKLPLDTYSHWFESALPQASQRQRYFKERIAGKPISHANFRLAHLLSEKRLATLVVTPNFDDFLPRALTLFGIPHIICDHPNTVERINPESDEIQVVHVHGTYWFYDGCNLRGEIEARTEDPRERSVTMTSLLGNIFSRHSAIVIGYAGWEGDVIMTALRRRLQSRLPNNLYWFCYRRGDADTLPDWLKNHRDVRIVLPPAVPSNSDPRLASEAKLAGTATDPEPTLGGQSELGPEPKLAGVARELEPTLTAQSVLDKLVEAFTMKSPALTIDPISFFADQLTKSFPPDSSEKPGGDIYTLRDVIRRVELARESEKKLTPIEAEIELVRDAVRRSSHLEALETAGRIEKKLSTDAQRERLMESTLSAAIGLSDNSEAEIEGYDLALRLAADMGASPRVQEGMALALYNKGVTLAELNRQEEALETYDELLRRFGDATEAALREQVADTLINKGVALGQLNRGEEAIKTYDDVLRRFGNSAEPKWREQVADALVKKGVALGQLHRSEEALDIYEDVLRRFSDAAEPMLRERVASALYNKGVTLGELNRDEEAIGAYDEVLRRFGNATELPLRERFAQALLNKAFRLSELNRREEGIQVYDEVLRRFGEATEPALRQRAANALFNKGFRLSQLNHPEQAIQIYDDVVRRFGEATEPALRERVAKALFNKSVTLGRLNRNEEVIQTCDEILYRFGDAPGLALREQVAKALVYKGQFLNTLKRPEGAKRAFLEVLRRFAGSPDVALQQRVEKSKAELRTLGETNT